MEKSWQAKKSLENELKAAKETIARLKSDVREDETNQGTKLGTGERESSSGRGRSSDSIGSPEPRILTLNRRKKKRNVRKFRSMIK